MPPTDRLILRGVRLYARHGSLPHEARLAQPFEADVVLETDLREAGETDRLRATVDYRRIYQIIEEVLTGERRRLIETLAHHMALALLAAFPRVEAVEVHLRKPHAPLGRPLQTVEARVRRTRADVPA